MDFKALSTYDVEQEREGFDRALDQIGSRWYQDTREQDNLKVLNEGMRRAMHMIHNLTARIKALESPAPSGEEAPDAG